MDNILFSDGKTPFFEEKINPVIGYQIIHKITGRIFYQCSRWDFFTMFAAKEKFNEVNDFMEKNYNTSINKNEWKFEPIYQSELDLMEGGYYIHLSEKDWLGI